MIYNNIDLCITYTYLPNTLIVVAATVSVFFFAYNIQAIESPPIPILLVPGVTILLKFIFFFKDDYPLWTKVMY